MSVCLSFCLFAWNNKSAPTRRIFTKFGYLSSHQYVEKIQALLKSDNNNGYFIWRPTNIYDIFFLGWAMFHTKFVKKIKTREIFRTHIDRPWVQLYNEYRVSRPEVKLPRRGVNCPTPLSAEL